MVVNLQEHLGTVVAEVVEQPQQGAMVQVELLDLK
jgi:hypothetical protein